MLLNICVFAFLSLLSLSRCTVINRTLLVEQDFLIGLKPGEFTVLDATRATIRYRIETSLGFSHNARILEMPAKTCVARLRATKISVFNDQQNRWMNGTIKSNSKATRKDFTIVFNGKSILLQGLAVRDDAIFIEQSHQNALATVHKRRSASFWRDKYVLNIFSNRYPDVLYLLGLAVRDHGNQKTSRG